MRYFIFLPVSFLLFFACSEDDSSVCSTEFTVSGEAIQPSQCGAANGAVTLVTSGGSGSIVYQIGNKPPQNSATFINLLPGDHNIVARDEAGCTANVTISIPEAEPQWTINAKTTPTTCDQAMGSIAVQANGGTAPYQYRLENTSFSSETTFDKLLPGEYSVVVQDANGCTATAAARVSSNVSFKETIHNIITTNCALAGCHAGGHPADFTVRDNIFKYAEGIQERTSDRSMPLGRKLTDEEIAQIDCWVGDGAPDN